MSKVTLLGKLPDPFMKEDGTRMSPEEWWQKRDEIRKRIVFTEFGGMPPKPEVVKIEALNYFDRQQQKSYRVHVGTEEKQMTFSLMLYMSVPQLVDIVRNKDAKYPVLLTGDRCYPNLESDTIDYANQHGIMVAIFNRVEIAYDRTEPRSGGIYDIYPEDKDFTAISAWAWGYSVVLDALSQLPFVDVENVGITGHSRGGKSVLLAAATDDRFRFVCPNNSGTHGCAPYRYVVTEMGDEKNRSSEHVEKMFVNFPHWMSKELRKYEGHIQDLPYDMHWFGTLIAPRYYLQCEGMQDYESNPQGSRQTYLAVRACYRYLGCEDHAAAWFRSGGHRQEFPDFEQFIDFMCRAMRGLPTAEHLQTDPYPNEPLAFDF